MDDMCVNIHLKFIYGTKLNGLNLIVFVPILINSKQIQKNIKFDLQVHFNMEIMLNSRINCLNFENKNMFILQIDPYVHRSITLD